MEYLEFEDIDRHFTEDHDVLIQLYTKNKRLLFLTISVFSEHIDVCIEERLTLASLLLFKKEYNRLLEIDNIDKRIEHLRAFAKEYQYEVI